MQDQGTQRAGAISLSRAAEIHDEASWACLTYNLIRWFGLRRVLQAKFAAIG